MSTVRQQDVQIFKVNTEYKYTQNLSITLTDPHQASQGFWHIVNSVENLQSEQGQSHSIQIIWLFL